MKNFGDLFNQFFGGKRNKKKNDDESTDFNKSKDENMKKIFDIISSMEDVTGSNIGNDLDEKLGEPNKIEYYEEDGMYFEKKTWDVFGGEMVKVVMSDEPFDKILVEKEEITLSLQEQLEEAVKNEEYEIAANIRDAIKKEEKKQKKLLKNLTN